MLIGTHWPGTRSALAGGKVSNFKPSPRGCGISACRERSSSQYEGPSFELFPQFAKPRGEAFGALALGLGALALGLGALALGLGALIRGLGALIRGLGALALGLDSLIRGLSTQPLGLPSFHELDVSQKWMSVGRDDSQPV